MRSRSMPTPLVELPCGSASMSSVFRSAVASEAARFTAVVVFPTPPFWLAIAITRDIITRYRIMSYLAREFRRVEYTSVSRETKERKFHVKLQQTLLGNTPTPPRRLEHQVVEVARSYTGNSCGLRERARPDAIEFLARFRRQRPQLKVGKVSGQDERRQLGKPTRGLALAGQIAVVLDLDFRGHDGLRRHGPANTCGREQCSE